MRRRRRTFALIVVGVAALAAAAFVALSIVILRPASFTTFVTTSLSRHLNLDAAVEDISISWLPRPRLSGSKLTLRVPNHPELPPFVSVEYFYADIGLMSALRRHVDTLHADGVKIAIPPGSARDDLQMPENDQPADPAHHRFSDIIVDHLVTHDAELTFVPKHPGDPPLLFQIHDLTMNDVAFDRALPFTVRLTNPVPSGIVEAGGVVGPWRKSDPDRTPISGTYVFTNADLSSINGIGGTLSSSGSFTGHLTAIEVQGKAEVPDFSLDLGGKPVPLTSTFLATVDGTDGTTALHEVDATILNTSLVCSGAITNLAGPGRHDVAIEVHVADGRIEDMLRMVLDSPRPVMTGAMRADARLLLPPGAARVRNRIRVSGRFGLSSTTFTSTAVQQKIEELSRRSQGKREDDPLGRVLTNLRGRFLLSRGLVSLNDLTFEVPGATVALDGTYALTSGDLNFHGTLAMQATVSQAVGGFKSIFIKPFDRMFKKDGAGAVLPIRIAGTHDSPAFSLEMGRVFHRGDDGSAAENEAKNAAGGQDKDAREKDPKTPVNK